jgi:hypothetical protein
MPPKKPPSLAFSPSLRKRGSLRGLLAFWLEACKFVSLLSSLEGWLGEETKRERARRRFSMVLRWR